MYLLGDCYQWFQDHTVGPLAAEGAVRTRPSNSLQKRAEEESRTKEASEEGNGIRG